MAIGLLTRWFFTATASAAQSQIVKGFQKATDLDRIMLTPLSQTPAAMAHICAMTAGAGPFGIQLSRAIRLLVEPILSLTLLASVVPCFTRYRNQTLQ